MAINTTAGAQGIWLVATGATALNSHRLWCATGCGSSEGKNARTRRASVLPLIWQLDACAPRSARKGSAVGRVDVEGFACREWAGLGREQDPYDAACILRPPQ